MNDTATPWRERPRFRLGAVTIDSVTLAEAIGAMEDLVAAGAGGYVVTPNVDHVVAAERHALLRQAYAGASLSLVDGAPVVWAARLLGHPLPEKVSGSDLVVPLMQRAGELGWRVFVAGGGPGVAQAAARRLESECGVTIAGVASPRLVLRDGGVDGGTELASQIRQARPHLVLAGFGAPKQEIWLHLSAERLRPAVGIAVGAALDFVAGRARRAPPWVSRAGLEWIYRLAREPRRLWRRYLRDDPRFLGILARALAAPARVRAPARSASTCPVLREGRARRESVP